ncbi:ABC transporter permease subunit [Rathayibacter sp. VKM Ac-2803]|uniref:carbohydrate ABC transporter permease n=1 Tax=unclassified Rathayibacter TaxID=2609250 RepID=UPI0013595B1B|nr:MULTISPECIES: carbohydrate ABC transporter permease [unclassified Rathayibacter]MWV47949.1 ABC transporter permease subunit [Rathayibacter sp. VKM Ac-2803]MWV58835.1 ABC transporter permease subunit [Rathayibacter sp. VKM Ac-2754]
MTTETRPRSADAGHRRGVARDRFENAAIRVLRPLIIVALLVVAVFPFYYMVLLSFRSLDSLLQNPGSIWIAPSEVDLSTYIDVLSPVDSGGQGFVVFLRNSFLVALGTVVLTLLVAIPGSYAVSRLAFFGRRQVSALFLAVYFFPSILLAVPLFVFFTQIGLRGSLLGLLIVYVSQVVAVSIYTLRNYFATIPVSLEEAAAIDGASRLQVMRRISLPLAMPAIVSNGLFIFMIAWNEFLFALLFLVERRDTWTVSLGLSQLGGSIEVPTTVLMAGSVILTLPIIVLFFASERLLTGGLTAGAEKG